MDEVIEIAHTQRECSLDCFLWDEYGEVAGLAGTNRFMRMMEFVGDHFQPTNAQAQAGIDW